MIEIFCIALLGIIIIALLVERHLFAREMQKQLSKAQAALFARNMNEYLAGTKENTLPDRPSEEEDLELPEVSDADFEAHIKQVNS